MEEIWKPIIIWKNKIKYDYTDCYEVSNYGRIRSIDRFVNAKLDSKCIKKGRLLKPSINEKGYLKIGLSKGGKRDCFRVHRIVYESFNGPIPDGYEINHKDENKQNNCIDNLEAIDHYSNATYGTGQIRQALKNTNGKRSKPVLQYDLDGNFIKEWPSESEICRQLGLNQSDISSCCLKKIKQTHNYVWKFKDYFPS